MGLDNYYLLDDMEVYFPNFKREVYENSHVDVLKTLCRYHYEKNLPVDVTAWIRVNEPDDNLIYRKGQGKQVCFVRDNISYIFNNSYEELKQNQIQVIGTHMSKSVLLPVMEMNVPKYELRIVLRYNFYDWKISVSSNTEIKCDFMNIFKESDKPINPIYCEGFPIDKVFGRYADNNREFTIEISDDYRVYTFMYLLNNYLKERYA